MEEILELGSETRIKEAPPKKANEALVTAISNLTIQPAPLKSSYAEVRNQAMESKNALEDYLLLLRSEPIVLDQAVNAAYWSRAELVADDRGRILPAITDRHLSAALFEAVVTTVKMIATWDFILQIIQLLDGETDKVKRALISQELSNTCHLEYRRAQESFKRNVAPQAQQTLQAHHRQRNRSIEDIHEGTASGLHCLRPATSLHIETLPSRHISGRCCTVDTEVGRPQRSSRRRSKEAQRSGEMIALGDIAIIVSFMHMTSTAMSMAPLSRKSDLLFTARSKELETELNKVRAKADFGDYLVPRDILLEPDMAAGALAALDDYVQKETGARI